jgi:hypothetical protein
MTSEEWVACYHAAIETVARTAAPVLNRVDRIARDRDDYRQELAVVALQAQERFRERVGFSQPSERRYVLSSLWNHIRSCFRSRARSLDDEAARAVVSDWDVMSTDEYPQARYEAREVLFAAKGALNGCELEILHRLAAAGGHVPRAFSAERDGSLPTLRRRVRAIRERVRSLE